MAVSFARTTDMISTIVTSAFLHSCLFVSLFFIVGPLILDSHGGVGADLILPYLFFLGFSLASWPLSKLAGSIAGGTKMKSTIVAVLLHAGFPAFVFVLVSDSPFVGPVIEASVVFLIFSVVWWLLRDLVRWFIWASARSMLVEELVADFEKASLPRIEREQNAVDYFARVTTSPSLPSEVRMAAGMHSVNASTASRITRVYDAAVRDYCRKSPG